MHKPNVENIEKLAALLDNEPMNNDVAAECGFGMKYLAHDCGSPSCIAGYAAWFAKGFPENVMKAVGDGIWGVELAAAEWLGVEPINVDQERRDQGYSGLDTDSFPLFYPDYQGYYTATPQEAAKVLRHFAKTGEIDWSKSGIDVSSEQFIGE